MTVLGRGHLGMVRKVGGRGHSLELHDSAGEGLQQGKGREGGGKMI